MLLLANQPEGLIAIAIIAIVAGAAIPMFGRLGFGSAVSVGLGAASGVLVVAAIVIRAWVADTLAARARRRRPPSE